MKITEKFDIFCKFLKDNPTAASAYTQKTDKILGILQTLDSQYDQENTSSFMENVQTCLNQYRITMAEHYDEMNRECSQLIGDNDTSWTVPFGCDIM